MRFLVLFFSFSSIISFSQVNKSIKVGVLLDQDSEAVQYVMKSLVAEIEAVIGQSATLVLSDYQTNNNDLKIARKNLDFMLASDCQIILSFGVLNTIALYKKKVFEKPIIAFGSVNSDFVKIPIGQTTSEIHNLNYIVSPFSFSDDLDVFKSMYDFKKIGILIEDFLIQELPIKENFDTYFSDKDSSYKLIGISKESDAIKNTMKCLDSVDAVYLAGNFGLSNRSVFIDSIVKRGLPSFSAVGSSDLELGVLASQQNNSNSEQFFRRIALNFEAIVSGTNPSELPLFIDYKKNLTINYTAASNLNFPLRYSMVGNVDFVKSEESLVPISALSILDVMRAAIGENLDLKSQLKSVELSENDFQSAKNQYLPDVKASAGAKYTDPNFAEIPLAGPELSTVGNVSLQQLIYSPNASAAKTIQGELNKAQQEIYNAAELDLLLNASIAYFNSLILKTNLNIQNQNLQVTKLNLTLAEQNFEEGATGKSDVLRFKSQLAQNTQNVIEAANELKLSYNSLNALLNRPMSSKIEIEDAEISKGVFQNYSFKKLSEIIDDPRLQPRFLEFLVSEANLNAPELKNLAYTIEAVKRNYRLNTGGRFLPTVALNGQYNYTFNRSGVGATIPGGINFPDGYYFVGVNVSLPIFQQNLRTLEQKSAKIQQEQLSLNQENTQLQISKNVNDMVSELATQIANIKISKIAEEAAKESLELTQTAYKNGAVPVIQLIDAQSNYLQSKLASATANYGYLLTSIQLERSIGYFFLMSSPEKNEDFIQRVQNYLLNEK